MAAGKRSEGVNSQPGILGWPLDGMVVAGVWLRSREISIIETRDLKLGQRHWLVRHVVLKRLRGRAGEAA